MAITAAHNERLKDPNPEVKVGRDSEGRGYLIIVKPEEEKIEEVVKKPTSKKRK